MKKIAKMKLDFIVRLFQNVFVSIRQAMINKEITIIRLQLNPFAEVSVIIGKNNLLLTT